MSDATSQPGAAFAYAERLTLAESTYGKEHLVTATCLNDVGTFAQMFRDFDRAEALFRLFALLEAAQSNTQ